MSGSVCASLLGPEFDDFLFAPLGEERNGMRLSVLSALTRLEVDPRQEAAKLAELPEATASERLASLIALLPNEPLMHRDPETIAARLVALLPRRASSNAAPLKMLLGTGKVTRHIRDVDGCRVGKPSTFGARRQSSYTGFGNNLFPGAPELWPVTIKSNKC
jgi:hypothetical protein